jgi:hypothetical protein
MNLVLLTPVEDEHYPKDPTHCNPKTTKQWGLFLRAEYGKLGWELFRSSGALWLFVHPKVAYVLKSIPAILAAQVDMAWQSIDVDQLVESSR